MQRPGTFGYLAATALAAFALMPRPVTAQASVSPGLRSDAARGLHVPGELPLDELPPYLRAGVLRVFTKPTLAVRGPVEAFRASPVVYEWLLDHPDQAVLLWRSLGAQCADITRSASGRFEWHDGQGGAVWWQTIARTPQTRVWYAEGSARPGPLLPAVAARAVVILQVRQGQDAAGRTMIRHQAELIVQTDNRTALLAARLLGASSPRLAEQAAGQIEIFFSALAWYIERHPEFLNRASPRAHSPDTHSDRHP